MSTMSTAEPAVVPGELLVDAGLPGFPGARRFTLQRWGGEASPFSVLHCLDVEGLDFVVVPPEIFFPDYQAEVDDATAERLGLTGADDAILLVILTLGARAEDATANLLGPVVINRRTLQAAQVVLAGSGYEVSARLTAG